MASRCMEAERLLADIAAERALAQADRHSKASDGDLTLVATLLKEAASANASAESRSLRGRITRVVVDTWSLDATLTKDLVTFDDHFMVT